MKKYLMTGIAAVAMCAAFTSCSKDVEPVSQEDLNNLEAEKIVNAYNQAFIATFGQPAANQTWGFGTTRAYTRTADPGDGGAWFGPEQGSKYAAMGIVAPEMVSADEERQVAEWFRTHQNPISDEIDLSTFFVQQVHFNHKEYTSTNSSHKNVGGDHMDWICAGSDEMGDDHINNFNANSPARYYKEGGWTNARDYQANIMLMVNSSTKRFGYKESANTENKVYHTFVLKALTINGKLGYYVGFDYEAHGQNGNFDADGYYDDRIIKVVPGNGFIPSGYDTRIIAEDLNAKANTNGDFQDSDWDFNDVVFDVKFTSNTTADVHVLAAGGVLPLTVAGHEVHGLFGVQPGANGLYPMINTAAGKHYEYTSEPFQVTGIDRANNGKDIIIKVTKTLSDGSTREFELKAEKGEPASKLAVDPDRFDWCDERQDITKKYTNFKKWVVTTDPLIWWE